MVLLHAMKSLAPRHGWVLAVAHFNHRLRGANAAEDARFVKRAAARLNLECFTGAGTIARTARTRGLSLEMAARERRHAFLARTARHWGATSVALAHHANDQAELFFLRLMRGSGTQGLPGMRWSAPSSADPTVTLIRPLLGITRNEIETYALQHAIEHREDSTNCSTDILRNRIRGHLLPLLVREFQPGLVATLGRTMEILAAEADWLDEAVERWRGSRQPAWARLHPALQRRILWRQLIEAGAEPTFELIEPLRERAGRRVSIGPGTWVLRDHEGRLRTESGALLRFLPDSIEIDLTPSRGTVRFSGQSINWIKVTHSKGAIRPSPSSGDREIFDAMRVGERVTLRHWQPGDRFKPVGFSKSAKVQDLLVNQKVPRLERHQLVVATTASGEIFWVQGLRIGDMAKVTEATRCRLVWRWGKVPRRE
jgi:tRNA(Ile)-lysidine synthase